MTWLGHCAIAASISACDSLNEPGDHWSNFSLYVRTAVSPFARMSSMTPLTMRGTSIWGPVLLLPALAALDFRYRGAILFIYLFNLSFLLFWGFGSVGALM